MGLGTLCAQAADVASLNYAVYFNNTVATAGNTFDIDICLKTAMNSAGYQVDIYLPEGMTVSKRKVVYDDTDCELICSGKMFASGNYYRLIYSDMAASGTYVTAGTDAATVRLTINAKDVAPGVYPIVLRNIEIASQSGAAGTAQRPEAITCMVELSNYDFTGRTDMEGVAVDVSEYPNAIIYAKEGQVSNSANVVIDGVCDNLVLTDKAPFSAPRAFTATNATYSRTVAGAGSYSIVLPFGIDELPTGVHALKFKEYSADGGTVTFSPVDAMEAHTPYILGYENDDPSIVLTATNVEVTPTPASLSDSYYVGTYTKLTSGTTAEPEEIYGNYALKADGSGFARIGEYVAVQPFRAYLQKNAPSNARAMIRLFTDNTTTGITTVPSCTTNATAYNLQGNKVNADKMQRGIFIVNNKKVVILN